MKIIVRFFISWHIYGEKYEHVSINWYVFTNWYVYISSIKNKNKEKWLENDNKNDKKRTLPYIQELSEKIRSASKKLKINVFFQKF